jgi:hypothetical protein
LFVSTETARGRRSRSWDLCNGAVETFLFFARVRSASSHVRCSSFLRDGRWGSGEIVCARSKHGNTDSAPRSPPRLVVPLGVVVHGDPRRGSPSDQIRSGQQGLKQTRNHGRLGVASICFGFLFSPPARGRRKETYGCGVVARGSPTLLSRPPIMVPLSSVSVLPGGSCCAP